MLKRKTLRFQIYLTIAITFLLIAAIFGVILYPFENQRHETVIRKIEFLINSVVTLKGESIANELFLKHVESVEIIIKKTLEIEGISAVGIYDEKGVLFTATDKNFISEITEKERLAVSQKYSFIEGIRNDQKVVTYTAPIVVIGETLGFLKIHYSLADVVKETYTAIIIFTGLFLTILLSTALILNILLTRFVIRPADILIRAMRKLQNGHLGEQVDIVLDNEIGEMSETFNQMSYENARMYNELNELNENLEYMVEKRTAELTQTKEYLENVLENSADGIGLADIHGKMVSWNKAAEELYGYTSEEIRGTSFAERYSDKNELEKMLSELRENGSVKRYEIPMKKKDGTESPFEVSIALLKDDNGKNIGSICAARDLSELKKALSEACIARKAAEQANKKIMDSINYAKMIQRSLLANLDVVKSYIPNSFFIWEPKDIVGGDIFFTEKLEDGFIVAVADCTGHGVPGAFMTMIAVSALRRIIKDEECRDPAEILKRLNVIVKTTLHQDKVYALSDDGMDVGIVRMENVSIESHAFGFQSSELMFAGAKIPLYYVRRGEINIIKGDRENIGYRRSDLNSEFTTHTVRIEKDMNFYMATDGFTDQLGGEKNRRFGSVRFRDLLKQISKEPFENRSEILLKEFEEHRADNERLDDMTVVGFGF